MIPESKSRYFDYLPVAEAELSWGLYVTGAGHGRIAPGAEYPPHDHPGLYDFSFHAGRTLPEYQFIFISEGHGEFRSEPTGNVEIVPGTMIILFPDVWHTYRPDPTTGWEEYWVSLNGSYPFEMCRSGVLSPDRAIGRPHQPRQMANAFQRLISAVRESPQVNSMLFSAMALEILALLAPEAKRPMKDADIDETSAFVREAVRIIWGWSYRSLSVADVAKAVGLNRRTLERYFRESRECSVLDEIARCRLVRAQRLLENTRVSIKQVALAAGFSTPERMAKVFQRMLEMSPSEYREKHAG
jgi:AraC-like DNA-binding protein